MKTMTAAEAKNKFGQFLDMAQREPVLVTKNDRPVGVFFSMADLEDTQWGERILKTHSEQCMSTIQNDVLRSPLLNDKV